MAVAGLTGCQKDDTGYKKHVDERLDGIEAKLDQVLAKVESGGGGERAGARQAKRRKRPARPDANTVFAVPTGDSPYKGAKNAKVTIVEGFEFA